jgi:hypothetical protein
MDAMRTGVPHVLTFKEAFMIFLKLNLRLRARDPTCLITAMLAVTLTILFSLTAVIPSSGGNALLEPNTTSIGDSRAALRSLPVSRLAVCPNSSFARSIINNLTYPHVTPKFVDNVEQVAEHLRDGKNSPGLGFALSSNTPATNETFDYTSLTTSTSPVTAFLALTAFSDQLFDENSIETKFSHRAFAHPATQYMVITAVYSFYYAYGSLMIGIAASAVVATLQETRF